jgi:hypothetical protein
MRILLTKLNDASHRFEIVRADGSGERAELETRSTLLHDLVHYAVEAQAGLTSAFFGRLASGDGLAELAGRGPFPPQSELAMAEARVGPMQSLWNGRASRAGYLEGCGGLYPAVVNEAFVDGALEHLRRLVGRWRATAYQATMELPWPPPERAAPRPRPAE